MAQFNCINCKYGMTTDDYEHCGNCDKGSNFVKMTNADRIRSMTDEELAEYISELIRNSHEYMTGEGDWLIWLQSEAE